MGACWSGSSWCTVRAANRKTHPCYRGDRAQEPARCSEDAPAREPRGLGDGARACRPPGPRNDQALLRQRDPGRGIKSRPQVPGQALTRPALRQLDGVQQCQPWPDSTLARRPLGQFSVEARRSGSGRRKPYPCSLSVLLQMCAYTMGRGRNGAPIQTYRPKSVLTDKGDNRRRKWPA